MTAGEHAARADTILEGIIKAEDRLSGLEADDYFIGIAQFNQDATYGVQVAQAHALTAIALSLHDGSGLSIAEIMGAER